MVGSFSRRASDLLDSMWHNTCSQSDSQRLKNHTLHFHVGWRLWRHRRSQRRPVKEEMHVMSPAFFGEESGVALWLLFCAWGAWDQSKALRIRKPGWDGKVRFGLQTLLAKRIIRSYRGAGFRIRMHYAKNIKKWCTKVSQQKPLEQQGTRNPN